MYSIQLGPLNFFAHHGIHEEEKILGNYFTVEARITATTVNEFSKLSDTIDYTILFGIIKKHMAIATPLLESIANNICLEMLQSDTRICEVDISISKLQPPIPGCQGKVGVRIIQSVKK